MDDFGKPLERKHSIVDLIKMNRTKEMGLKLRGRRRSLSSEEPISISDEEMAEEDSVKVPRRRKGKGNEKKRRGSLCLMNDEVDPQSLFLAGRRGSRTDELVKAVREMKVNGKKNRQEESERNSIKEEENQNKSYETQVSEVSQCSELSETEEKLKGEITTGKENEKDSELKEFQEKEEKVTRVERIDKETQTKGNNRDKDVEDESPTKECEINDSKGHENVDEDIEIIVEDDGNDEDIEMIKNMKEKREYEKRQRREALEKRMEELNNVMEKNENNKNLIEEDTIIEDIKGKNDYGNDKEEEERIRAEILIRMLDEEDWKEMKLNEVRKERKEKEVQKNEDENKRRGNIDELRIIKQKINENLPWDSNWKKIDEYGHEWNYVL